MNMDLGSEKIIADERIGKDAAKPRYGRIAPEGNLNQSRKTFLEVEDSTPNTLELD